MRVLEPLEGAPWVRAACEPKLGWSQAAPEQEPGSNHVDYAGYGARLRLTSDVPLAYVGKRP